MGWRKEIDEVAEMTVPEKPATVEVEVRGKTFAIDPDWREDYEVVIMIGQMDQGNPMVIPPLMTRLIGEQSADFVTESLRGENGIIRVSAVREWIIDFISACNAKNI